MSQFILVSKPRRVSFADEGISISHIPLNHAEDLETSSIVQNINYDTSRIMESYKIFKDFINPLLFCVKGLNWNSARAKVGTYDKLTRFLSHAKMFTLIRVNGKMIAKLLTIQQIRRDMLKIYESWREKRAAILYFKSGIKVPYKGDTCILGYRPHFGFFKTGSKIKYVCRLRTYLVHVLKVTNPILKNDAAVVIQSAVRSKLVRIRIEKMNLERFEMKMKKISGGFDCALVSTPSSFNRSCTEEKFYKIIHDPNVVNFMAETYQ